MSLIPYFILSLHYAPRAMPLPKAHTTSVYIIGAARLKFLSKILKPVSTRLITSAVISFSVIRKAAGNVAHKKRRNTGHTQTNQNLPST